MEQSKSGSTQKNLSKIKNIVIVMFENHSFDNMLGWLYENRNPPRKQTYEGLHRTMWNPLNNIDADGVPFVEKVPVHKNGESTWKYGKETKHPVDYTLPDPDPGEGFKDTNHQLFEKYDVASLYPPPPTNMGFVNNYKNAMLYGTFSFGDAPTDPRKIMTTYTTRQLPVLSKLAKNYAVCDHWFCSVPSQTLPNRDFIHAATSTGYVNNSPNSACDAKTIYNQIEEAIVNDKRKDLSWKVYGSNPLTSSKDDAGKEENGDYFSLTRVIMTQLQDSSLDKNFQTLDDFYTDCKNGTLPRYSFLEPIFSGEDQNDQHPPSDVRAGEQFMADIYNSVVDSPQWEDTLLVITYDEHGGCFDHVAPPEATPPRADKAPGQDGFRFNRYGVRVPTVLISPWIQSGTVCRPEGYTPFDHTSVISTARELFGLKESLTERDKYAPTLDVALQLDKPRKDKVKLYPLKYKKKDAGYNDLHQIMVTRMKELTGLDKEEQQDVMEYIHEMYEKHFYPKKSKKK